VGAHTFRSREGKEAESETIVLHKSETEQRGSQGRRPPPRSTADRLRVQLKDNLPEHIVLDHCIDPVPPVTIDDRPVNEVNFDTPCEPIRLGGRDHDWDHPDECDSDPGAPVLQHPNEDLASVASDMLRLKVVFIRDLCFNQFRWSGLIPSTHRRIYQIAGRLRAGANVGIKQLLNRFPRYFLVQNDMKQPSGETIFTRAFLPDDPPEQEVNWELIATSRACQVSQSLCFSVLLLVTELVYLKCSTSYDEGDPLTSC
jgi:hypothetical protein